MNFKSALKALKDGSTVKRKAWEEKTLIIKHGAIIDSDTNEVWEGKPSDTAATDWETTNG